ncbi:PAN domain-containing protein, partial [Toxoplasma gondii ARI]
EMTEATTAVDAEVLATDGLAGDAAGTPGESDGATGKKKRRGKKRRSKKGEKAGDAAATPGEGGVGSEMTEATTAVDVDLLATGGLLGDVSVTREVGTEVTEDTTAAEIDQLGSDGLAGDAAGTPGESDGATGKKRKRGEKKHRSRRREKRGRAGATRGETAADAEKTKKTTLAVLDLLASGLTSDAAAMPGDSDGATGKKRKRREKKHRSRRRERSSKVATLAGEGDAVEGEMPQDEGVVEVAASGDDTSTRSVAQEGLDSVKNAKKTHRKRSRTHKRKTADDKTASEHASEAGKFLLAPETGPTVSEESLAPGETTSPENTEQVASDVRQETDTGESEAAMMLEKEDDDTATGGSEEDEVLMPQDEEAREQEDAGDNLVSEHGLEADEAVSAGESPTSESTEQVTSALPPATDDETQEASKKAKRRTAKKSRSKKREKSSEDMEAEARSMSGQHGKKKADRRRSQKPESSGYSRSVEESRSTDADSQSRGRHDQTLSSLRRRRKNIGSATEEAYMDGDESISEASATQKKHMTTESRRRRKGSREAGGGFDEWVFQSDDDESIDYSAERSRSTRRRRADRDGRDRKGRERRHMSSRSRHSEELSESPNSDSETRAATEDGETSRTSRRSHRRPFTMSMLDDEYDDELRDADDLDEWSISSYPGAFEEIRRHSETGHRYGHNTGVPGSQRNREEREISILDPFYPPSQHVPQADFLTQDSPSQRPNAAQLTALIQAGVAAVQAVDKVAGKAHGEAPQSQLAGPGTAVGKTQSASHEQKDAARAAARTLNLEAVAKLLRGHHSDARASTQSVGALLHRNYSRLGPSATESARKLHWENLMTALTAPHLRQPELYRSSSKHRSERRGIDGLDDIVRNRDSLTFAQDRFYESKEFLTPDSPVYEDGWSRRASRSRMESEDSMSVDWLHKKHESRLSQRRRLEKQRHRSSKSRGEDRDETFDDADSGKDGQRRRPGHIVAFEDSYPKASHLGDVELVDDEELSTDIEQLHSKMKEELTRDGELEASWGSSADLEGETAQIAQGENWDDGWEKVEESEAVMEPAEVQQESLLQRDAPETDDGWMQTPVDPGDWKRAIMEVLKSGHVSGDVPLKQWLPGDSWQEFSGLMSSISDVVRGQHTESTSSERFGALRMAKKEEKPLVQMDDSCFERNVRYSPGSEFIVVWRGVPTASHCQALCKLTAPECHFFSFVKSAVLPLEHQGACYLLPRKAPVVRVPSRGVFEVTSGPRSCSPPTPDSPPLDLVAVTSRTGCPSSPSVCDSLNLPFPLGSRFSPFCSTSKEGHCANLANGIPCCTTCNDHPGNPCPEKTCYEYNVDYTDGTELRFFAAGVASRGACESLCRQTEGCTHYSYYSTPQLPRHLRGSCSLRAFRFAPRNRVTVEGLEAAGDGHSGATRASVVFAPLFCEYPQTTTTTTTTTTPPPSSKLSCNRPNTDFWGHDLASFKGCVSADACQRICQSVDGCVGFTYVKLMQKCYLKWSATVERHVEGHESGPRCCAVAGSDASSDGDGAGFVCPAQRKKPCVFAGQDYPGHDITIKLDTVSAYKCFQLCKAERRCEVWTHRPEKKMCFLKWAEIPFYQTVSEKRLLLQEEFVVAPGAITGFADCEPFYGPDADKFTVPEAQAKAEAMRILSQNLRYGRDEGSTTGAYEETTNNGRKEYARPLSRSRRRGMSEDESTSRRSRSAEFSEDEESVTRRRRLKRRTRPVHQDSEEETHSMTAHRTKRKHRSKRKHSTMDEEEDFQTKRKRAHRQGRS